MGTYIGARNLVGKFVILEIGNGKFQRIIKIPPITVGQYLQVLAELSEYKPEEIPIEAYDRIIQAIIPELNENPSETYSMEDFQQLVAATFAAINQLSKPKTEAEPNSRGDVVDIGYALAYLVRFYGFNHSDLMNMNILHFNNYLKWISKIKAVEMSEGITIGAFPQADEDYRKSISQSIQDEINRYKSDEEIEAESKLDEEKLKSQMANISRAFRPRR